MLVIRETNQHVVLLVSFPAIENQIEIGTRFPIRSDNRIFRFNTIERNRDAVQVELALTEVFSFEVYPSDEMLLGLAFAIERIHCVVNVGARIHLSFPARPAPLFP